MTTKGLIVGEGLLKQQCFKMPPVQVICCMFLTKLRCVKIVATNHFVNTRIVNNADDFVANNWLLYMPKYYKHLFVISILSYLTSMMLMHYIPKYNFVWEPFVHFTLGMHITTVIICFLDLLERSKKLEEKE